MQVGKYPHYVFVEAVLFDGKIWKWNVRLEHREVRNETMTIPKGDEDLFIIKDGKFFQRFSKFSYPIFVTNEKEHEEAFRKAKEIYKMFPIHEDYCMGVKPY